jgi:hypothetical protein
VVEVCDATGGRGLWRDHRSRLYVFSVPGNAISNPA